MPRARLTLQFGGYWPLLTTSTAQSLKMVGCHPHLNLVPRAQHTCVAMGPLAAYGHPRRTAVSPVSGQCSPPHQRGSARWRGAGGQSRSHRSGQTGRSSSWTCRGVRQRMRRSTPYQINIDKETRPNSNNAIASDSLNDVPCGKYEWSRPSFSSLDRPVFLAISG